MPNAETAVTEADPGTDLIVLLKGPVDRFPTLVEQLTAVVQAHFQDDIVYSQQLLDNAKATPKIDNNEVYIQAAELRNKLRKSVKDAADKTEPMKSRCNALWDIFGNVEKAIKKNGEDGCGILDPALTAWEKEVARLAAIEKDRLDKLAIKEQQKLNEKAAAKLVDEGHDAAAADLLNKTIATPASQPSVSLPKVAGQSTRPKYSAELVSLKVIVKAAASNDSLLPYLQANMTNANKTAEMQKELFKLPGFRLVISTVRTSR